MTEYYNVYNQEYVNALKSNDIKLCTKIIMLNWFEDAIADVTKYCDLNASSIVLTAGNAGGQNGTSVCRRKATLKFNNLDGSFEVDENKSLWALRKFKILRGIEITNNKRYWFSQGIYCLNNAGGNDLQPECSLSDKASAIDGTLMLGYTEAELQIPDSESLELLSDKAISEGRGLRLGNVIKDLISTDMGNGYPLDPKEPVIDPEFEKIYLQKQCVVSAGFYQWAVINELAKTNMYNAFYDIEGRLRITRNLSDDYYYLAPLWTYTSKNISDYSESNDFSRIINAQTVTGSNVDGKVFSYTAVNTNPRSPIRADLVGLRRDKRVTISNGDSERKCQMYAEYLLKRKTASRMTVRFKAVSLPHIDVDKPVLLDDKKYIVQSVTIPLSAEPMQIEATNIDYIPFERW